MLNNHFEKRNVWVLTIWLKETDEEGEESGFDVTHHEEYARTLREANEMRNRLLNGEDEVYGDWVESVDISYEEVELLKLEQKQARQKPAEQKQAKQGWEEKTEEIKKMQEELDRRTEVEEEAVSLIEQLRFKEAVEALASLDDKALSV